MRVSPEALLQYCLLTLVTLSLSCNRPSPLPDMGLSTTQVQFIANGPVGDPPSQSLYVLNTGEGALEAPSAAISYNDSPGWLSAVVMGNKAPYEVQLTAALGRRAPGRYLATLTLASPNASSSPLQVPVTLDVPEGRFSLEKSDIVFMVPFGQANPPPQRVAVTNGGRGSLPVPQASVSAVGTGRWLVANVETGSSGVDVVTSVDVTGLDVGTYLGTVTLTAVASTAAPVTLGVKLVVGLPEIVIDAPADGTDPAVVAWPVANVEGTTSADGVVVKVAFDDWRGTPWLSAAAETGKVSPLLLTLRTRSMGSDFHLPTGDHWATVSIAPKGAAGQPTISTRVRLRVPVSGMKLEQDHLSWTPASSRCDGSADATVDITSVGAGSLPVLEATVSDNAARFLKATVAPPTAMEDRRARLSLTVLSEAPETQLTAQVTVHSSGSTAQPLTLAVDLWFPRTRFLAWWGGTDFHLQVGTGAGKGRSVVVQTATCRARPVITIEFPPGTPPWLSVVPSQYSPGESTGFSWNVRADNSQVAPDITVRATMRIPALEAAGAQPIEWTLTTGALQAVQPMAVARFGHTLTSQSLESLGGNPKQIRGILAAGGNDGLRSAEVFDLDKRVWAPTGSMSAGRSGHAAIAVPGGVLVCGGRGESAAPRTCELWSATTGTWKTVVTLLHDRIHPTMAYHAFCSPFCDVVYIADDQSPVELIDLADWSTRELQVPGGGKGTVVDVGYADTIIVGGGTAAYTFDPRWPWQGPFSIVASHPRPVVAPIIGIGPTHLLLLAGEPHDRSAVVLTDFEGHGVRVPSSGSSHARGGTVSLLGGRIAGVAGFAGEESADIEVFDPVAQSWSVPAVFPSARAATSAGVFTDGTVVFSGGTLVDGSATAETFIW